MQAPSLDQLVEAGVHFGHKSSRWNPKMQSYIFATRNNIHIINLDKTREKLEQALGFIRDLASSGGTLLFVGTKRQARDIVKQAAESCEMPYVTERWLGGTFTNFKTIQKTIQKLEKLEQTRIADDFELKYTKKERLTIERQIQKMKNFFGGIKDMKKLPDAIFTIDINHERIAVTEAHATGVKVVALVDTNSDPEKIDYLIPGNDDAIKSIALVTKLVADAVNEGKANPKPQQKEESKKKGE